MLNLLLVGGAFVLAGLASAASIFQYDGGDLSSLLTLASLILFFTAAIYLRSVRASRSDKTEWARLAQALGSNTPASVRDVRGTMKDVPVHARIETSSTDTEYFDSAAAAPAAAHYFALSITVPSSSTADWRILYRPKEAYDARGEWRAVCREAPELAASLESAGITNFFAEWDCGTVLRCQGATGTLTLRYPVRDRSFCPSISEIEHEVNFLRRAAAIWQHAHHPQIAA